MHFGKEMEAQGRLSCDSDAPQVGSARPDSTRFVKVNRRKTNRRKTRPYCICFFLKALQPLLRLGLITVEA